VLPILSIMSAGHRFWMQFVVGCGLVFLGALLILFLAKLF
jgi:hypothetical protein